MGSSPARVVDQDFAVCVDVLVPQTVTLLILIAGSSCMEFGADLVCQRQATRRVVTKVLCAFLALRAYTLLHGRFRK